MSVFCNTTAGEFGIFRELITAGHDHGGFFGPVQGTGEIVCVCGQRFTRAELTAPASEAAA
jgi:hypothetical protein